MQTRRDFRADLLTAMGANSDVQAELLSYDEDGLGANPLPADIRFPLADEACLPVWREYRRSVSASNILALADRLVQLRFPIQRDISTSDEYRAATRRGVSPDSIGAATGLPLAQPDGCTVRIHQTWAGSIPIIQTACREDFVSLLQAFTARNEPVPVPASQGACIVAGYNNWDRVNRLRERWTLENPTTAFSFDHLADRKDEYQDRFILLSSGSYSGVAPERLGLTSAEWRRLSLTIRCEHECAHYWTRRVLSSMGNRVFDEVVADSCGIYAACGRYRADWQLAFLGIDEDGSTSGAGRFQNYCGTLSNAARSILARLVVKAAANLEHFDRSHADEIDGERGLLLMLLTLSGMSLEHLASSEAQSLLTIGFKRSQALAARAVTRDVQFLHERSGRAHAKGPASAGHVVG